jgi:hypothetical protein
VTRAATGRDGDAAVELAARLALGGKTPLWLDESESGRAGARIRRELQDLDITVDDVGALLLTQRLSRAASMEIIVVALPEEGFSSATAAMLEGAATPVLVVRGPEREHAPLAERLKIDRASRPAFLGSALGADPEQRGTT